jgi:peptidoglycan/LPS O-acetylase OafA/YrhL
VPLQPKPLERNGSIDALRGLFSLIVLATHTLPDATLKLPGMSLNFLPAGYCTVRVFFAISGYLVYKTYARRRLSEANAGRNFLVRRFFRIIPMWWAVVAAYWVLGIAQPKSAFANLFLYFGVMSWTPGYVFMPQSWSLFVEEVFYLAFPFLFDKLAERWRLAALGLGAYFASSVWLTYAAHWGYPNSHGWIEKCPQANFQYFFIGIAIARMQAEPGLWKALSGWRGWNVVGPLSLAALAAPICSLEVTVSLLLLSALLSPRWARGWLDNRSLRWVGKRCYSFYLTHYLLAFELASWPSRLLLAIGQPNPPQWALGLASLAIVGAAAVVLAWLSDALLEGPMVRLGEKLIRSAPDPKHPVERVRVGLAA